MNVSTDEELTHAATDASFGSSVTLIIQPDTHGLTVELPNGGVVTLDVNAGQLGIYFSPDGKQAEDNCLQAVSYR